MAAPGPVNEEGFSARLIAWCVHNRFFVLLVSTLVAIAGIWSLATIPLDAIPDLSDVQVIVSTEWMGRDPQTVEDQVTYPVSQKMLSLPKVKDVRGYSFFGLSFVYVIFEDGTDLYWARTRVLEKLNEVQGTVPPGVTPTLGPDATGLGWVYLYTLEAGHYCPDHEEVKSEHPGTCPLDGKALVAADVDLGQLRALQDWYVRYQLESVAGVAEVAAVGGHVRQYQITVDPTKLLAHGVRLEQVTESIRRGNNDVGGRVLELGETELMVRGRGYLQGTTDIEQTVVATSEEGVPILVRDVASVGMGPDIRRGVAEKNGQGEVVAGVVVMRLGENALTVIARVKKKMREVARGLPPGVVVRSAYDRSALIERSIDTLSKQLLEEMLIVALVCVVFLWHARSALVAAVTLPLGVLLAFIVMRAIGIPANIMSLGGIAIAVGAMVDAAVVMVENTHKHLDGAGDVTGAARWQLVIRACQEVGPALFFSLLVITVSFLPVFALEDQAGRLFKPLAYTKTFAMAASALLAVVVMPPLIGIFVRGKIHSEERNPISRVLVWGYLPVLRLALRRPKTALAVAAISLVVTLIPLRQLGSEFMPPLREGDVLFMPTTLPGLSASEARRTLQIQDRLLAQFPEVKVVLGKIGRSTTSTDPAPLAMVETHVSLKPEEEWPRRIVPKGVVAAVAEDVLDRLVADGIMRRLKPPELVEGSVQATVSEAVALLEREGRLQPRQDARFNAEDFARSVAASLRARLDERIRQGWLAERSDEAARGALPEPAALTRLLGEVLTEQLKETPALAPVRGEDVSASLADAKLPAPSYRLRRPAYELHKIAEQIEGMARPKVNDETRRRYVGGETLAALAGELPERVSADVLDATPGLLLSLHAVDAPELTHVREHVRDVLPGVLPGEIPLERATFTELTKGEMQRTLAVPGMPNWWLMPIETRIGMLTTGMRGILGIKLRGERLADLDKLAVDMERVLKSVPGTQSVAAERVRGGRYLDIDIRRQDLARHGLTVAQVQEVIEVAVGGKPITYTIEGRYRFPVNVRYPRELRDDPQKLARVLVATPLGEQVPLGQLTDIHVSAGPPVVKSENGLLLANVPVDLDADVDIGTYVARAEAAIAAARRRGELVFPPGSYHEWSGQFQMMRAVRKKLMLIVPVTLAIIFLLLYLNMRDFGEAVITMVTLPFALIGGFWLMHALGYHMSVAVGVGFIALAGLAAETAVIMHVYLELSYGKKVAEHGQVLTRAQLHEAVEEGAVLRVRPKMMTVMTTILGLLPIMWAAGTGAGPMKRMAAPMIGGLVSSTIHTLVLIPVYYALYKQWLARRATAPSNEEDAAAAREP